jgi:copper transport protein
LRRTLTWSLLGLVAVLVATVALVSWPAPGAQAHAVLERSSPTQSQTFDFDSPPQIIESWYTEPLERQLTKLTLYDSTGEVIPTGETTFSDADPLYAATEPQSPLGPGVYTVGYANVSTVDGHAWSGQFSFIIKNEDGSTPSGGPVQLDQVTQGYLPDIGDTIIRWFSLLASAAIVGAAAFYLFVARPAADFLDDDEIERVEDSGMSISADLVLIAVPIVVLSVVGQAFLLADRLGGPGNLSDIMFNTRTGELWIARSGVAIALLLLFLPAVFSESFRRGDRTRLIMAMALIGGAGMLMTFSLGSHAAIGGGEFWSVAADFVHFLATAAWLGALFLLPLVFWWTRARLSDEKRLLYLANVLDRFAWLAVVSVVLLIGTGVFNGFVQLPTKEALWETTYGRVLIAKLALILPLLGVAGLNAVFISPRLSDAIDALHNDDPEESTPPQERPRFQRQLQTLQSILPRTAAAELLVGVAVLVTVAVLTQTTTAEGELREDAGKPSGQFVTTTEVRDLDVELAVEPFGVGLSTFTLSVTPVTPGQFVPEILDVRLRAFFDDPNAPPTAGSSGVDQDLEPTSDPTVWSAEAALLTQPGDWRIQARIRQRGEDDATAQYTIRRVGGVLADTDQPDSLFDLPFTFVDWNIAGGGAMLAFGVGLYLIFRNRPRSWQPSTGWSVAASAAVSMIAGATLLFGVHAHTGEIDIKPATEESILAGQAIFTKNCVACHGQDGRGGSAVDQGGARVDLTQHVPYHGDQTLYVWISEGLPLDSEQKRMPAWKDVLSSEERQDVVNYLRAAFSDVGTLVLPEDETPEAPAVQR